jgi:hypothetical protein
VHVSEDSEVGKKEKDRDGQNERTPHIYVCQHHKTFADEEGGAAANYRVPTMLHVLLYISVISLFVDCTNCTFRPSEVTLQLGVSLSDLW